MEERYIERLVGIIIDTIKHEDYIYWEEEYSEYNKDNRENSEQIIIGNNYLINNIKILIELDIGDKIVITFNYSQNEAPDINLTLFRANDETDTQVILKFKLLNKELEKYKRILG